MSSVYIDPELKLFSRDVPHKKIVIGSSTWLIAPLPAGDFAFHRHNSHDTNGYGGCFVDFLLDDGTTQTFKGPYRIYRPNDFGTPIEAERRLGIPGVLAQASKITVGKNIGYANSKSPEVVYRETQWRLGDWKDRVKIEWRGFEFAITKRGSIVYPSRDELRELFNEPRFQKVKVPAKTN